MTLSIAAVVVATLGAVAQALPQEPSPTPTPSGVPGFPPDFDFGNLPTYNGTGPTMLRFGCHQLLIDRLDPLIFPGAVPSHHQHQIVGGDAFTPLMPLSDIADLSDCTGCSYSDDFSNYWTANLYFRARNGSYKRVNQIPNLARNADTFIDKTNGGMTIYYVSPGQDEVTAFAPGFRMFTGDAMLRSAPQSPWNLTSQNCFRCFTGPDFGGDFLRPCQDPAVDTMHFPTGPCYGIRSNVVFPTCWDGVNLDSADHKSHVAYPVEGPHIFDGIGTADTCPPSHPVKIPQLMVEVIWDTTPFNDPDLWPEDGSQPFVLSSGDTTGYSQHADYVFGWRDDSLQVGMEAGCSAADCPGMAVQTVQQAAQCTLPELVGEHYDGWLDTLPGDPVQPPSTTATTAAACPTGKGKGKGKGKSKGERRHW